MRLYIAGPMSGLPDRNYPAFFEAEAALLDAGYQTINPARTEGREDCVEWIDFMRASLLDLAHADGVATLPRWASSRGATIEVNLMLDLGLPIKMVEEWLQ